jgi:hypothetical protein
LTLVHGLGVALLFDPISGLFDGRPVIEQDWGLHFHHLRSLGVFWKHDRALWGYNPFFMAGYPSNTIQDLSIKLFELLAIFLSAIALTPLQWFKLLAFLSIAAVPVFAFFAARNVFATEASKYLLAVLAALIGTLYWWNSLPREMFFYGMLGYPAACYASVLGVSLFYRISKEPRSWSRAHLGWLFFAALILPLHVQAVVICLPAILTLLAVTRSSRGNLLFWCAGGALLAAVVNFPWLAPAFSHRGDDASAAIVEQLPIFTSLDPLVFVQDYLGSSASWSFRVGLWEKVFRLVLLVAGSWGTVRLIRSEHRSFGIALALTIPFLCALTYCGSFVPPLRAWQPLRFKVALDVFLLLPAAYAVMSVAAERSTTLQVYSAAAFSLLALVGFLINLMQTESLGKMHLRTEMIPEIRAIVDWIGRETPPDSRVLFEESGDETGFVYNGIYLSSLIPQWTGRQLIGGPINLYNDRHHFAEFHSGKLFKRDIQTFSDEEIRSYFRLYNISSVVAFYPASINRLLAVPGLVEIKQRIGPVHLMKVNQRSSWFVRGGGKIQLIPAGLRFSGVTGRDVMVKYHWIAGLIGRPGVRVVPERIADDPIPFIRIIDPPSDFDLSVGQ